MSVGPAGIYRPGGEQTERSQEEGSQYLDRENGGVPSGPARVGPCVFPPNEGHIGRGVIGGGAKSEKHIASFDGEVCEGIKDEPDQRYLIDHIQRNFDGQASTARRHHLLRSLETAGFHRSVCYMSLRSGP